MADWPTEEEMDRRHAARLALMQRCIESSRGPAAGYLTEVAHWQEEGRDGFPPAPQRPAPARLRTEEDERIAAGLIFSVRDERREAADAEHRARRASAEREVASRERLHRLYRDTYGLDEADRMMS
jgi:hypothetical protein